MIWEVVFHLIVIVQLGLLIRQTSHNSTMVEIQSRTIKGHNETLKSILNTQDVHHDNHLTFMALLTKARNE